MFVHLGCFLNRSMKMFNHHNDKTNSWVPCSKPPGGSKVDSAFHPSEVGKMSTRNFWELSGKK